MRLHLTASMFQHADELRQGIEDSIQGLKISAWYKQRVQKEEWRKKILEGWEEQEIVKTRRRRS